MVIYREEYRLYNFGPDHPFSPVRLEMLTSLLQALGVWRAPLSPPEASGRRCFRSTPSAW